MGHTYEWVILHIRTRYAAHTRAHFVIHAYTSLHILFAREIMEGGKNVVRSTYLHFVTNITAWQAPLARDGNELYHTYQ